VSQMNENEDNRDMEHRTENQRYKRGFSKRTIEHKLDFKDYMAFFIASLQTIFLPLIVLLIALVVLVSLIVHFI
jgi:hypothetical protein